MKEMLRDYQKRAVDEIYNFFCSNETKAKIYLSTGLGKTAIIVSTVEMILENNDTPIVILSSRRIICEQVKDALVTNLTYIDIASYISEYNCHKILVTTYQDILRNKLNMDIFSMVICDEAQFLKKEESNLLFCDKSTKFLGVLQNVETSNEWFYDARCLFRYTIQDAFNDGYINQLNESNFIEHFVVDLLDSLGFEKIHREIEMVGENSRIRPDIIAEKEKKTFVIEVKFYRNLFNSKVIVNNAIKQVLHYKQVLTEGSENIKKSFIIIMLCKIDIELKKDVFKRHNIVIWDINNLLYLSSNNKKLSDLLTSCLAYPIVGLEEDKPLDAEAEVLDNLMDEPPICITQMYQERLSKCKSGKVKKSDKKYERICTEIIKYLFETEFLRFSEQHKTDDHMFRMDLLCSLKGTTEFWKFLIRFYSTKFVVFEYKNYSDFITQNLIYITEKYLFPVALRNVAFIMSRKGFDLNAQKAALGCLRESGKLIVSLDDNDLIKMVSMKENGEEPSDYLLDKVEQMLMLVSK